MDVLETVEFEVDRSKVAELARSFGDDDGIWFDDRIALAAGMPAPPTQPTVTVIADHWREGGALAAALAADLDVSRLLHGEVAWDYLRPIRVGDELTARTRVLERTTRAGKRGGEMTFVTIETTFTNQRDEVAARRRDTLIETEAAA